jgi:hypothetical protein
VEPPVPSLPIDQLFAFLPGALLRCRVLADGSQVTYAFIERHRRVWPISVQRRVLKVSVAG